MSKLVVVSLKESEKYKLDSHDLSNGSNSSFISDEYSDDEEFGGIETVFTNTSSTNTEKRNDNVLHI